MIRDSLSALDLDEQAGLKDIKTRYKQLVKRYHPDANGGDNGAEDRLKRVIQAYRHLTTSGHFR
jgi:DnaJ-class molecular chaperone